MAVPLSGGVEGGKGRAIKEIFYFPTAKVSTAIKLEGRGAWGGGR